MLNETIWRFSPLYCHAGRYGCDGACSPLSYVDAKSDQTVACAFRATAACRRGLSYCWSWCCLT